MGQNSQLRSPKKEEQLVPKYSIVHEFNGGQSTVTMDDFEGIFGVKDEEERGEGTCDMFENDKLNWDFMDCEEFSFNEDAEIEDEKVNGEIILGEEEDEDTKKMSLNLSLNYQDVIDSWSSKKPLWIEDSSLSPPSNYGYMGEVPVMEEDRSRREASVLRYKEKRQNRLFAKKIRYEVRKLNADKRPRLKGRFVKRNS